MFSTGDGTFSSDLAAIAFALALLLLPVALGLLLAAALRSLLPARRWQLLWAAPLVLGPVALSLVAIPRINALSFWDVLLAGLCVAAGLTLGMFQPADRVVSRGLRAGARVLAGLLIAEVIVRVALPSPGSVPPPRSARLVVPVTNRDPPCNVIFPTDDEVRHRSTWGAPGRPTVLHIGDSLVAGIGVSASENFVSDLNAAQPSVRHLNLGSVGAGPDVYLLALSRWLPAARPRLAVVYVFAGNDLFDLNARYLCCPQGLLRDEGSRIRLPQVIRAGLHFGDRDPLQAVLESLARTGLDDAELLRERFKAPATPLLARTVPDARWGVQVARGTDESILQQALLLGLCSAWQYDPSRPVLWTRASLTRRVELYEPAGFYA